MKDMNGMRNNHAHTSSLSIKWGPLGWRSIHEWTNLSWAVVASVERQIKRKRFILIALQGRFNPRGHSLFGGHHRYSHRQLWVSRMMERFWDKNNFPSVSHGEVDRKGQFLYFLLSLLSLQSACPSFDDPWAEPLPRFTVIPTVPMVMDE